MTALPESHRPLGVPFTAFCLAVQHLMPYQREQFEHRFGRSPMIGDPIFFDPAAMTPTGLSEQGLHGYLLKALAQTQADPTLIQEVAATSITKTFLLDLEKWLTGNPTQLSQADLDRHPLFPYLLERIRAVQIDAFHAQFGYPPRPSDPLFFDPHAREPKPYPQPISITRLLELLESYLDSSAVDPLLLHQLRRITHSVVMMTIATLHPA